MSNPSEKTRVVCPQCSAELAVVGNQLGTQITCSDCLEDFIAVASEQDPKAPQASSSEGTLAADGAADEGALQRLLNPDFSGDETADDRISLGDLGEDVDSASLSKANELTKDYEFGINCHLCGTRLNLTDADVGKTIRCPDCHSELNVREPSAGARRVKATAEPTEDYEFRLAGPANVEAAEPFQSIASDLLSRAESETAPPTPRQADQSAEEDALQRAQDEYEEEEAKEPPLPPSPFWDRLFSFLLDPNAIGRLVFLAVTLFILLGAVQLAVAKTEGNAMSQFISVIMRMFGVAIGVLFLGASCASMQGILQDTSYGMDEIESWPDLNFVDWLGEMFYILNSLFVSVIVPAFLLAQAAGASEMAYWTMVIAIGSCGLVFVFPFLLLSMLESGSPINPISPPILRSVSIVRGRWIQFTLVAAVVVAIGAALTYIRIRWNDSTGINFAIAIGLIVIAAVFFRLIGRLAWCCRVGIAEEDERLEEAMASEES